MFCLQYKNFIEDTPLSSQTQLSVISPKKPKTQVVKVSAAQFAGIQL
jgi:hypothetical protein